MSWAKLDDQLHAHPKVLAAWRASNASVGLHAMALSYCGAYLTDGHVPPEWVAEKLPDPAERDAAVGALERAGMWTPSPAGGWEIHDYLEHNPSRRDVERRRESMRKAGRKGAQRRWANG